MTKFHKANWKGKVNERMVFDQRVFFCSIVADTLDRNC